MPARMYNPILSNLVDPRILSTFKGDKMPVITLHRIKNAAGDTYAVLSYNPEKNYLLMKWFGYSTEEEVKLASLQMLDWQRREGHGKNCRFHVHDTKEIEGAWIGVVDWINTLMFPLCYQVGLRYNLSVVSPDLFSRMSSVALQQKKSTQVPTVLFETLSQAEQWLLQKSRSL